MKLRLLALMCIVSTFLLPAARVMAEVPNQIDPGWQDDPLKPDVAWWRDGVNQNDLAAHFNDEFPQIPTLETVADGVYVVHGLGLNNTTAIVGETSWVLVDTLASPEQMQLALYLFRTYTTGKTLTAVIYTGYSYFQFGGSSTTAGSSPTVYAQGDFHTVREEYGTYGNLVTIDNLMSSGSFLDADPDGRLNPDEDVGTDPYLYPTQLIATQTSLTLAGTTFTLIPAAAPFPAGLTVWLPDKDVIITGGAWSPSFPNIGPVTGRSRIVPGWVTCLNDIMALAPGYLVPLRGPILAGTDIATNLTNFRDAMQQVYDDTQVLIGLSVPEYDAAAQVELDPPLSADPYLQPFFLDIPAAVHGIYNPDTWRMNCEPPELLKTLTTARRTQIALDMTGDADHMRATALDAELAADDLASAEGALLMAWMAYQADTANILGGRIYAQALTKNAFMQRSNILRNRFLSFAKSVNDNLAEDSTDPTVSITAPVDGARYPRGRVPPTAYTATDDTDPYPYVVEEGWGEELGPHILTVTATDFAGNSGEDSVSYTVYALPGTAAQLLLLKDEEE